MARGTRLRKTRDLRDTCADLDIGIDSDWVGSVKMWGWQKRRRYGIGKVYAHAALLPSVTWLPGAHVHNKRRKNHQNSEAVVCIGDSTELNTLLPLFGAFCPTNLCARRRKRMSHETTPLSAVWSCHRWTHVISLRIGYCARAIDSGTRAFAGAYAMFQLRVIF
jgi:hypothetical protein